MAEFRDLTGQRFGRWFVVDIADKRPASHHTMWLCRCVCGNEKAVCGTSLTAKKSTARSTSCGCYQKSVIAALGRRNRGKKMSRRKKKKAELEPKFSTEVRDAVWRAMVRADMVEPPKEEPKKADH
jgi:hypothetical protein